MDSKVKISNYDSEEVKEEYWNNWLEKASIAEDSEDWLLRSVYEVMKIAIENKQYSIPFDETTDVTRLVKVNLGMPRSTIEQVFGIKTYSIYGNGIYILMDGIILSRCTRDQSGYDTIGTGRKSYFDVSFIDPDIIETHEVRLVTPALGGLFLPKKSRVTDWISSRSRIQYFDLMKF